MRRHFTFPCEGVRLFGTIDQADGTTGLLILTGGNELRSGAWAGQAQFAARIAAAGYPVLRFDRRGCGDSEGVNAGFRGSAADIAAAMSALRAQCPQVTHIVAMGNCDAASALMLASGAGADGLILSNPWTFDDDATDEAPPQAVRSHYRQRLRDLGAIKRLLTGQVAIMPLLRSLLSASKAAAPPSTLAQDMAAGIASFAGPIMFPVAGRDRTGLAFASGWSRDDERLAHCASATHSFVEAEARDWLVAMTLDGLRALDSNASK
ncbi:MAG: hydrolase 1, exosortase A system-associated [Hyphomicrobiaceae bacterium]